jgi:hypothetical protein
MCPCHENLLIELTKPKMKQRPKSNSWSKKNKKAEEDEEKMKKKPNKR